MKTRNNPLVATLSLVAVSITSVSAAPLYWKNGTMAMWDSATWGSASGGPYDQS